MFLIEHRVALREYGGGYYTVFGGWSEEIGLSLEPFFFLPREICVIFLNKERSLILAAFLKESEFCAQTCESTFACARKSNENSFAGTFLVHTKRDSYELWSIEYVV